MPPQMSVRGQSATRLIVFRESTLEPTADTRELSLLL
jgi:hypothetical protein